MKMIKYIKFGPMRAVEFAVIVLAVSSVALIAITLMFDSLDIDLIALDAVGIFYCCHENLDSRFKNIETRTGHKLHHEVWSKLSKRLKGKALYAREHKIDCGNNVRAMCR